MMKKVTLITPPEYEGLVLESLAKSGVVHLTEVTNEEYADLRRPAEDQTDYKELYRKVKQRFEEIKKIEGLRVDRMRPSEFEIRQFALDPNSYVKELLTELDYLIAELNVKQEEYYTVGGRLVEELNVDMKNLNEEYEAKRAGLVTQKATLKAKVDSLQALAPEELKSCFTVGIAKKDVLPELEEYMNRYEGTYFKTTDLTEEESLLFVFGDDEAQSWVESLFVVFDIKDIFDVLDSGDILLVLDPNRQKEAIVKYRQKLDEFEKQAEGSGEGSLQHIDAERKERIAALKAEFDAKIKANEEKLAIEINTLESQQRQLISKLGYFNRYLRIYTHKRVTLLKGKVISVINGYITDVQIETLRDSVKNVEKEIGATLYLEVNDIDPEVDMNIPTQPMDFRAEPLDGLWTLTSLRGWPNATELNPGWISVIVFSLQFGLMFGDIGQGLIFLVLGYFLAKKYDTGMMAKMGSLFIPMGISAMIFGFLYDSIFLNEHVMTGWLHANHIELPFRFPIMPSPATQVGELMNLIFLIGAIEIVFGALLGAYNAYRAGNIVGMFGEHGFGMGLYVTGLYLGAGAMFTEGLDVLALVAGFPFKLMLLGMGLSFAEPVAHSIVHGHGVSIESLGEGVGGLLMTFVEGLANMFSFLRIAAFALAHASLAGAGLAMGVAIGNKGLALVIMNIIALTFEFVSSSVQSLRLLYYEFMGKFFQGAGLPFKPFRIRKLNEY